MGYARAGFEVVGVDIVKQPHYPFEFHKADAVEMMHKVLYLTDGIGADVIHASPTCYAWSKMRDCRPGSKVDQPDYITPMRPLLESTGLPWVMENVPGSPLLNPVQLCGSGFGLPLQRHRWFESNVPLWGVCCAHGQNQWNPAYGHSTGRKRRRVPVIGEWRTPLAVQQQVMGIDWMTLEELTEAVPPVYTRHVGEQLLAHLEMAA